MNKERAIRVQRVIEWALKAKMFSSQKEIASRICRHPGTISKAANGEIDSEKFIRALCKATNGIFSHQWIMSGDGDVLADGSDPEDLYNTLRDNGYIQPIPKRIDRTFTSEMDRIARNEVNFYPYLPVSAGNIEQYADIKSIQQSQKISLDYTMGADFCFPVKGMSMQPTIMEGDIIGVKRITSTLAFDPDRVYMIVTTDNQRMIKRINSYDKEKDAILLVSDNKDYRPFHIEMNNIVAIFKVMWKIELSTL